jgi:hypothetical protein
MEEVALPKTYENTRPDCVVITRPRRAFLQFLHHNHTPSPLAGLRNSLFHVTVSRVFRIAITIKKIAARATLNWVRGLVNMRITDISRVD